MIKKVYLQDNWHMGVIFMLKTEELKLVSEWDKTFPKSEKVDHEKVIFVNRYGITLAADLYKPKNVFGKYPAIAVSGPFGAVKEQCSGLYAQTIAEKGYLTIAFDPSFTGESGGNPRFMDGWNSIGCMSFMNQPILKYSNEIRSAVLIVHGEKAHSYYFGKDAYENMIKDSKYTSNKELLTIPGAVHTDLYDNLDVIPFDKIQKFFEENGVG